MLPTFNSFEIEFKETSFKYNYSKFAYSVWSKEEISKCQLYLGTSEPMQIERSLRVPTM